MPVFEYNAMQKSYVKLIVFKLDFKLELFWGFFVFYNSLTYTQLKWGLYETLPKFEILGSVYVQVFPVSQAKYTVSDFFPSYSWVYVQTDDAPITVIQTLGCDSELWTYCPNLLMRGIQSEDSWFKERGKEAKRLVVNRSCIKTQNNINNNHF